MDNGKLTMDNEGSGKFKAGDLVCPGCGREFVVLQSPEKINGEGDVRPADTLVMGSGGRSPESVVFSARVVLAGLAAGAVLIGIAGICRLIAG